MNRDPREVGTAAPLPCGTYFCFNSTVNGVFCGSAVIDTYHGATYRDITLDISNAKFAIGGSSLFPNNTTITQSEYNTLMESENAPWYGYRPRTTIVYIGGGKNSLNTALLTVHGSVDVLNSTGNNFATRDYEGVTLWELRTLVNDVFSPMTPQATGPIIHAIALDGGGSTQIAY